MISNTSPRVGQTSSTPEKKKATSAAAKNNKNGGYLPRACKQSHPPPSLEALQSCMAGLSAFARCLPLKIGIHQDLIALGHSKNAVHRFLGWWTKRREYLHALARGGYRYGSAGKLSGAITAEHMADAKQRFQGKKKKGKVWGDLKTPKLSVLAKAPPKKRKGRGD